MTVAASDLAADRAARVRLDVKGAVQGVGFRPFVYREATRLGLAGWVTNTPDGVTIEAEGSPDAIDRLVASLRTAPPPNAVVTSVATASVALRHEPGFEIRASTLTGQKTATVLPDLATCPECLAETFDPGNRRYRYPFTNCTHCGPRFSIIAELPYDRARTTMRGFPMCAECQAEYDDPGDRRFHAEPNACPVCGPQLVLWDKAGAVLATRDAALGAAERALRDGAIVAVKGIGGFHLMVDARNEAAVRLLRERKARPDKPFAVMFATLEAVRAEAEVGSAATALLTGRERPIVLLPKRADGSLAPSVAPTGNLVGAMLPYAPLHHLLLADLDFPVVATSGNRADEPIVIDETEAIRRLAGIADVFLVHDRPIVRPLDNSVARIVAGKPMLLRRARGYAPATIASPADPGTLALGGHLKAAVALTAPAGILVSQHFGDLDTPEARDAWETGVADLIALADVRPRRVVHDLHPDYHSTHAATAFGVPSFSIQHHLAHVAAVMAEYDLAPPVLGVAWDGTGYGEDDTVWGGEFIRVSDAGWGRVAHLRTFALPGGERAVREPRRSAIGLLHAAFGRAGLAMADLAPVATFTANERETLAAMIEHGTNAPLTSSAGRLFDAVAALLDLVQRTSYEGQAGATVEAAAGPPDSPYPFALRHREAGPLILDWQPALEALLADLRAGVAPAVISAAFHDGLALAIAEVATTIGDETVTLGGGCFQNARLTEATIAALAAAGHRVYWPQRLPPNDGGLALGQAWWAEHALGDD